ncbi:alpha/beta hydrolase [Flavobacterium sp.]|uniref:alpha/beta fold hydrolase n=1 Tax=Flavobacterium sp. TaxID=239 RepID=UPI002B4AF52C|nr:alpha/beta hydrolase [Flavobacterium sp.]HLP64388.1 alpha/beta hydrolase [Flavobacterium sp.]
MKKIVLKAVVKSVGLYINTLSYLHPKKSLSVAYQLFSQPRKGKLKHNQLPKTLVKAEQESHSHNEHQFYTHTWKGNDDIILLVHGWESNASRWKKTLSHLKKTGKTIIAIDGPAHGLSSGKEFNVPLYCEFIDKVVQKHNPTIAIGHSIGGNALAYFQAHYPHNFDKMVLIGAPSDFKVILNNYISMLSLNSRVHQQLANYTKERFNIIIEEFSASNFLKNSTIPGIIAHDIHDDVVRIDEAKKIANSWKTAQFIETENLGHSMHDEKLYQTIIEFIQ